MTHVLTAPAPSFAAAPSVGPGSTDTHLLDSHLPLVTQTALDARIRQLIPCAVQPQVWLILLDADEVQMPVMIPIGEVAGAVGQGLRDLLESLVREFEPASFVFVVERPGSASPTAEDRCCIGELFAVGHGSEPRFRVRAVYLSHDDGVAGYRPGDVDAEGIDDEGLSA